VPGNPASVPNRPGQDKDFEGKGDREGRMEGGRDGWREGGGSSCCTCVGSLSSIAIGMSEKH